MQIPSQEVMEQRLHQLAQSKTFLEDDPLGRELGIEFVRFDPARGAYLLRAQTRPWMRNIGGTVHGGICAAMADHAMGMVSYCIKGDGIMSPTTELNISYHRPLLPDGQVELSVRIISVTKSRMHLTVEGAGQGQKVCFSATGTYHCK